MLAERTKNPKTQINKWIFIFTSLMMGAFGFLYLFFTFNNTLANISSYMKIQDHVNDRYSQQASLLIAQMNLEQKVGQLLLPTIDFIANDKGPDTIAKASKAWQTEKNLQNLGHLCGMNIISDLHIGAVLQAGNPIAFTDGTQSLSDWKKLSDMAKLFYNGPKGTMLLLGTDAIHGDQHVTGTILFPHSIGLGATHNPELVQKVAYWTMKNIAETGFNWSYMPTVAIAHDYRWGRTYESFSSNPKIVKALSFHYVKGLQDIQGDRIAGVMGCAKHFIGDGATVEGRDEGNVQIESLDACWEANGAGYEGAMEAQVASLMVSYNDINDIPMHFGGDFNILNTLKTKGIKDPKGNLYRFSGFIASDYDGVSRAAYKESLITGKELSYVEAIAKSINGGVDMFMIANGAFKQPFDYKSDPPTMLSSLFYHHIKEVRDNLIQAVNEGLVSQEKLDDSVMRVIKTKLAYNDMIQSPLSDKEKKEEFLVSLEAAKQSLVLLKNEEKTLPLSSDDILHVFLIGDYDDIGVQNGGWTVTWQGQKGNQYWRDQDKLESRASSLLDGLSGTLGGHSQYYKGEEEIKRASFDKISSQNAIAVVVLSEPPYAEYMGDVDNQNPLYAKGIIFNENHYMPKKQSEFLGIRFTDAQREAILLLKKNKIKVVTILFSGRPLVITEGGEWAPFQNSDAFIAAFLPGTSGGEAIVQALFGNYSFKSHSHAIDGEIFYSNTLPFAWPANMDEVVTHQPNLFPIGYGLEF